MDGKWESCLAQRRCVSCGQEAITNAKPEELMLGEINIFIALISNTYPAQRSAVWMLFYICPTSVHLQRNSNKHTENFHCFNYSVITFNFLLIKKKSEEALFVLNVQNIYLTCPGQWMYLPRCFRWRYAPKAPIYFRPGLGLVAV